MTMLVPLNASGDPSMSAGVRRSPSPRERQGVTQFLGTIPAESDSTGDVGRTIFEGLTSCMKAAYLNDLRNGISTVLILDLTENFQSRTSNSGSFLEL